MIQSKPSTKAYIDNYDKIFKKEKSHVQKLASKDSAKKDSKKV